LGTLGFYRADAWFDDIEELFMKNASTKKHDHRQSLWLIAGGNIAWCYQCGAWKINHENSPRAWNKPVGIGGANPAMKDYK
jgi:hypothetical protein